MRAEIQSLPNAARERWQPLRSGFINLYRYDQEEFQYENGRLLLRGNNGTGKSRVLALQLPFLFDGEVDPRRLEPDADPSKKIEWNLLMGRYPDRTGYTWIEFGRLDESGDEHFLTLGCGLGAIESRPGVRQWFFITSQRIGRDLELVSDSKQVLGQNRLIEKIGSAGKVFESASAYRCAVNEALFHLEEDRYAALMNLLIQLRRPQLTRRLEEHELSETLSEALPPVSPTLIAGIADAFRNLQSDRNQLDCSTAALGALEQFLPAYRAYAQAAARRRADRVLAAHYEYEAGMNEILDAEAECDRSLTELAQLKAETQRLSQEEHALQTEIEAFQRSPQLKDAIALEHVHRQAVERRKDAECAAAELADASRVQKGCIEEHLRLRAKVDARQRELQAAVQASDSAALSAGLHHNHRHLFNGLDFNDCAESDLKQAQETIKRAIDKQIEKAEHVQALNQRVDSAQDQHRRASAEREQLSGLLVDACEQLNRAREEHRSAVTSFLTAVSDWTADLTELGLPCDETFLTTVSQWCDQPYGPNPFASASRKAAEELIRDFAGTRGYLKQLEKTNSEEVAELEVESARLISIEPLDEEHQGRLLQLKTAIAEAEARLDPVIDSLEDLDRRESILRSEAQAAPADDGVRASYDYSVAVSKHLDILRSRIAQAEEYERQKQFQAGQIREHRNQAVIDLDIGDWADDLNSLTNGISRYRLALCSLCSAIESFREARAACNSAWAHVEQATARENRQRNIFNQFEERAIAAEIPLKAAGLVVNAGDDEIIRRVAAVRHRLEQLRVEANETRLRYHDTEVAVTRLDERLRSRTEFLNGQTDCRNAAAASLLTFASTGLLQLAAPGMADENRLKSSMACTVEAAFELVSRLASVDASDAAWDHHQKSLPSHFATLMQTLSALKCHSSATFRDDLFVATAMFAGREHKMDELRQILSDDVADRQKLLDAREREILENHLVGKVSTHLRELMNSAAEQVRQMNVELESRPMSTGMKLRFVWRPNATASSNAAELRGCLMQLTGILSHEERRLLGTFLHQQIQAACSDAEDASWQESIARALDYRKWHWFGVERYQNGVWKPLTRRTHGTGSGGEKAVALTLPHFAAAAAFYRTADPLAPRLILLDEAFVGIDADMRAKCMGLIHTFDLDFIMTSEREWGCYHTLPGLAIYHLSAKPGIDAVGLTRWVWNGQQRTLGRTVNIDAQPEEVPEEISEPSGLVALGSSQI